VQLINQLLLYPLANRPTSHRVHITNNPYMQKGNKQHVEA